MGCSNGVFTDVLSSMVPTVGLDLDKNAIAKAKISAKHIDFICADLRFLPFRKASADIVVCSSVLEFIENLEEAVKQIEFVLKKGGVLVAGYPIETKFLKTVIKLFGRKHMITWDPRRVMAEEEYRRNPHAHKQRFPEIRDTLSKHFSIWRREKIPSNYCPDFLSIYECAKLVKR
jgi:ubiquinone/menaquinone biosynthesis C-methylase UbiE